MDPDPRRRARALLCSAAAVLCRSGRLGLGPCRGPGPETHKRQHGGRHYRSSINRTHPRHRFNDRTQTRPSRPGGQRLAGRRLEHDRCGHGASHPRPEGESSEEGAHFDREIRLDAANLPPLVTWGTSPEQDLDHRPGPGAGRDRRRKQAPRRRHLVSVYGARGRREGHRAQARSRVHAHPFRSIAKTTAPAHKSM